MPLVVTVFVSLMPLPTAKRFSRVPSMFDSLGVEVPIQPDGGEGLVKHKGVIARWRLKAVRSKTAT